MSSWLSVAPTANNLSGRSRLFGPARGSCSFAGSGNLWPFNFPCPTTEQVYPWHEATRTHFLKQFSCQVGYACKSFVFIVRMAMRLRWVGGLDPDVWRMDTVLANSHWQRPLAAESAGMRRGTQEKQNRETDSFVSRYVTSFLLLPFLRSSAHPCALCGESFFYHSTGGFPPPL